MSRHDHTPIPNRIISPNRPAIQGAQQRLIAEIDEWLDADDDYVDDAVPYELDDEQRVSLFDMIMASLAAMVFVGGILFIAWHLGKLLV